MAKSKFLRALLDISLCKYLVTQLQSEYHPRLKISFLDNDLIQGTYISTASSVSSEIKVGLATLPIGSLKRHFCQAKKSASVQWSHTLDQRTCDETTATTVQTMLNEVVVHSSFVPVEHSYQLLVLRFFS